MAKGGRLGLVLLLRLLDQKTVIGREEMNKIEDLEINADAGDDSGAELTTKSEVQGGEELAERL